MWFYIVMDILALRQWRDENVFELWMSLYSLCPKITFLLFFVSTAKATFVWVNKVCCWKQSFQELVFILLMARVRLQIEL